MVREIVAAKNKAFCALGNLRFPMHQTLPKLKILTSESDLEKNALHFSTRKESMIF